MSWSRTTAIVTSLAEVTRLTGAQGLANLEDELDSEDLLLTSSKEVFDRLKRDGIDPTLLDSDTVDAFERCVAYTFLHHLQLQGHLGESDNPERFQAEANRQYKNVRPTTTSGAHPAGAGEPVPYVINQPGPRMTGRGYLDDDLRTIL